MPLVNFVYNGSKSISFLKSKICNKITWMKTAKAIKVAIKNKTTQYRKIVSVDNVSVT